MESPKSIVILSFVSNTISCNGIVRNVFQVSLSKVESCAKHSSRNARDPWMMFTLNIMKLINEALVVESDVLNVAKNFVQKLRESIPWDNGRIRFSQRCYEHLHKLLITGKSREESN